MVDLNAEKSQFVLFDLSNNSDVIDAKMNVFLKRKLIFQDEFIFYVGTIFLFYIGLGLYIVSIAETTSKKTGTLTQSGKLLSPGGCFHLHISTI